MNKPDLTPAELIPREGEKIHLLMDANRDNNVYNSNQYPGFDGHNLYIGMNTPLDIVHKFEQKKRMQILWIPIGEVTRDFYWKKSIKFELSESSFLLSALNLSS